MFVLKLEQNLFDECAPEKRKRVEEQREGDCIFRRLEVDFFEEVEVMTVERRKYPYFYKYYLYWNQNYDSPIDLRTEKGIRFLLAFYGKYCPDYVKDSCYCPQKSTKLEDYFDTEKIPGEAMQHFVPGKGAENEEACADSSRKDAPAISVLEGYHAFDETEKQNIGNQLDALKDQFADQIKELSKLMEQQKKEKRVEE